MEKRSPIRTAEILCVGTELLLGDIVNTNAAYLARRLASLGIAVYHQSVVGDNPERLDKALTEALGRSDLIVMSGGLGPTYDDLTKETVAAHFGRKMHRDEESLKEIERYFSARYGDLSRMTPNNQKQADIPDGAFILRNPHGTAPGILLENGDKAVAMLPGPPRELEPMTDNELLPYLRTRTDKVFLSRDIHIMGMGESQVEHELKELMTTSTNPTLAPYAKEGEVRLRVTASAEDEEKAAALCDGMIALVRRSPVGEFIYGIDVGSVENAFVARMRELRLTVATVESCTGGMIAERITDIPGASEVLRGGFVTYTEEAKRSLVGVKAETLAAHTAVSSEVAGEMARGARERLGVDLAISTTGYAGPGGGDEQNPVGTIYIGISTASGETVTRLSLSSMRSRDYIRRVAASRALLLGLEAANKI